MNEKFRFLPPLDAGVPRPLPVAAPLLAPAAAGPFVVFPPVSLESADLASAAFLACSSALILSCHHFWSYNETNFMSINLVFFKSNEINKKKIKM